MTDPEVPEGYLMARDELLARRAGVWAKDKLDFLSHFMPSALNATQRKLDRVYIDLFAGPGLNRVKRTGEEFEGSPLRAMKAVGRGKQQPRFTQGIFCNVDAREIEILQARMQALAISGCPPLRECAYLCGDTNRMLRDLMKQIHHEAYVFAFADIEGVGQLPWSTIEALRAHHRSVDLYVLAPVEMSWSRLLGTNPAQHEKHAPLLNAYFGCEDWRPIARKWLEGGRPATVRQKLLDLYVERLKRLWTYAEVVEVARYRGNRLLYRMIFASDSDVAARIASAVASRPRPERNLELF